jgi:pilus assembly protein Flp/PilA
MGIVGRWNHIFIIFELCRSWIYDRHGATAIEYGLIAGGIALVISGAVILAGEDLKLLFQAMADSLAGFVDDVDL